MTLSYLDHSPIRQLVALHQHGGLIRELLFLLDIVAHVAQLLLHDAHSLEVCRVVEGVAPQQQELDQVSRDVAASDVEATEQYNQHS